MGKFHDYLGSLNPDEGYPEDFTDALTGAYDEDFAGAVAKNDELTASNAEWESKYNTDVASLKAANYDLLMSIPKDAPAEDTESETTETDAEDADIDDLFEKSN